MISPRATPSFDNAGLTVKLSTSATISGKLSHDSAAWGDAALDEVEDCPEVATILALGDPLPAGDIDFSAA
ncbi:hypothetical protein [Mesorhizobium sp. M1396]|uniref:hypothetical protein n=1 Tax=Mesorhizobium sp. M1396 TaxID=2957095 RepID=UPI00333A50A0